MKNIIFVITIGLMLLFSASCNKDFLDKPDLDQVSTESFWKTPSDLNLFVTQFYPNLPSWSPGAWNGGIYWWDSNSDNMIHYNVNNRLAGLNTIETSNGSWDYGNIRSINLFLSKYEEVDAPFEEISQSVGEGYFFRAWFYWSLLRNYGGVPWIDRPLVPGDEELTAPRAPRDVITNHILDDLDKAIEYMNSGEQSNGNRLNKECALLLKSRVALYEGTWEKHHAGTPYGVSGQDGSSFLEMAANTSRRLIDNPGGYSISNTGDPEHDCSSKNEQPFL